MCDIERRERVCINPDPLESTRNKGDIFVRGSHLQSRPYAGVFLLSVAGFYHPIEAQLFTEYCRPIVTPQFGVANRTPAAITRYQGNTLVLSFTP